MPALGKHPTGKREVLRTLRALLLGAAGAVLGVLAFAQPAHAARTINSVLLSYSTQTNATSVTVPPGAAISATVNVTHTGGAAARRWRSTSWRIGAGPFSCADHADFDAAGTDTVTFSASAPGVAGTYDAQFIAYQDSACTTAPSATFTLVNGVSVAVDNSTVSASPTSVPADGFATSTVTVTIRDAANNPVAGKIVTLTALSGSSSISAASGPSNSSGIVIFSVWNSTVQSVTYRATNKTDGLVLTQTATVSFTALPALSFNVVEPGANAFTGRIFTKIAGGAFALDIVARSGAAPLTTFVGTVRVEVVDSSSGGACAALPLILALPNQTFVAANKGRRAFAGNMAPNAYRNARVRVGFPAAAPTTTSCSGDNYAIRPASLTFSVRDGSRTTAGTLNVLDNTAIAPGSIHNAGRPFTIAATARNGAAKPAVTSNYNGSPTASLTVCASGAACTPTVGALAVGAWIAGGGTVTTNTATYDDVGAFTIQLVDSSYAAVDSTDGTPAAQLTIPSALVDVGRFVPDGFVLSAGSALTPRAALACVPASTFAYMNERMQATFRLTAVAFGGLKTSRYAGLLGRLVLTDPASFGFGAIDAAAPTGLTARVDTPAGSTSGAWVSGDADVSAQITILRAPTPDGPYNAVRIGIAPADPDIVTLVPAALDLDADASGSNERARIGGPVVLRFGRLRLQNAHGSELIEMPVPMQAQYWNGTAFVVNAADSCTAIAPANVALGNYRRNLNAGETAVATSGTLAAGVGTLRLSAPGAANGGSLDLSVNLSGAAAGASCIAGMSPSTPTAFGYLQGAWCGAVYGDDPTARATFGVYRSSDSVIFQRENY